MQMSTSLVLVPKSLMVDLCYAMAMIMGNETNGGDTETKRVSQSVNQFWVGNAAFRYHGSCDGPGKSRRIEVVLVPKRQHPDVLTGPFCFYNRLNLADESRPALMALFGG